jgi:hypothetical protein
MFTLILGLILLAIPFILVNLFSDKKRGFVYVLFFLLVFQTILAIFTQSLGIFYYWVITACTLLADVTALSIYFYKKNKPKKKFSFNFKGIDWVILAVAIISIASLAQVHFNYTGKIALATDQNNATHNVKNMVYNYPYFSDEWYAVSLVQGSINNHSLPIRNILTKNNRLFRNLELFFHSFLAEIFLILGLNPLLDYTLVSVFINTLIILLIYLLLRISNISKLASGVCSLLALYITCGANLPGLWNLIPFNLGILVFMLGLCFMEFENIKMAIFSSVLASFFYPKSKM